MIKTLEKKEFIKFLKIISHNLDLAEIKHDIPFCHIDKQNWNYINIIIPDFITTFDLMKLLNTSDIKEKNQIIYSKIDDFDVRFIKSNEQMWQYNFYYYSWDILHILFNIITSRFSMEYTRNGLYYKYKDKQILISKNLKDIFEFFDLPFYMIAEGFANEYILYFFIENSKWFNSLDFSLEKFKKLDYYFENNMKYYENFLKHIPNIESKMQTIDEQIAIIDAFFPNSDFFKKLTKIHLKEEFPNLKETEIFKKEKNINVLLNEKEKEIKKLKQKRKINLSKHFKKKDNPGNDEFKISD